MQGDQPLLDIHPDTHLARRADEHADTALVDRRKEGVALGFGGAVVDERDLFAGNALGNQPVADVEGRWTGQGCHSSAPCI
ncbi:hypothetical protein HC891_27080 [Candidatus Gracilibacteria bacterium]|nr:hypothetical protein [Candidatus Gracilibacteria bacterium]